AGVSSGEPSPAAAGGESSANAIWPSGTAVSKSDKEVCRGSSFSLLLPYSFRKSSDIRCSRSLMRPSRLCNSANSCATSDLSSAASSGNVAGSTCKAACEEEAASVLIWGNETPAAAQGFTRIKKYLHCFTRVGDSASGGALSS